MGVNFSSRESTFPLGVNFSRGSQLFPRESTFPEEVNFSRGSQVDMCFFNILRFWLKRRTTTVAGAPMLTLCRNNSVCQYAPHLHHQHHSGGTTDTSSGHYETFTTKILERGHLMLTLCRDKSVCTPPSPPKSESNALLDL